MREVGVSGTLQAELGPEHDPPLCCGDSRGSCIPIPSLTAALALRSSYALVAFALSGCWAAYVVPPDSRTSAASAKSHPLSTIAVASAPATVASDPWVQGAASDWMNRSYYQGVGWYMITRVVTDKAEVYMLREGGPYESDPKCQATRPANDSERVAFACRYLDLMAPH